MREALSCPKPTEGYPAILEGSVPIQTCLLEPLQLLAAELLDSSHDGLEGGLEAAAQHGVLGLGPQPHAEPALVRRQRQRPHVQLLQGHSTAAQHGQAASGKVQGLYGVVSTDGVDKANPEPTQQQSPSPPSAAFLFFVNNRQLSPQSSPYSTALWISPSQLHKELNPLCAVVEPMARQSWGEQILLEQSFQNTQSQGNHYQPFHGWCCTKWPHFVSSLPVHSSSSLRRKASGCVLQPKQLYKTCMDFRRGPRYCRKVCAHFSELHVQILFPYLKGT